MKRPSRAATEVATMEHRELVVRAQAGDGDAFAALASAVVDRCYALAYRVLRDPDRAKDATQQALLGVWRDLPTLRELDRFDAWLHRLVVNACYAESRSNRRWQMRFRVLAVPPSDQRDLASSVADRDALENAFGRLSPEHRAVVVLHHYLGYPLPEIAAVLEIPVGTAKSRLHYAVRQLRAALDADGPSALSQERPA
jgi:RNA polymerase sigma-70 factor, ECF subfamily